MLLINFQFQKETENFDAKTLKYQIKYFYLQRHKMAGRKFDFKNI